MPHGTSDEVGEVDAFDEVRAFRELDERHPFVFAVSSARYSSLAGGRVHRNSARRGEYTETAPGGVWLDFVDMVRTEEGGQACHIAILPAGSGRDENSNLAGPAPFPIRAWKRPGNIVKGEGQA